MIRFFTGTRYYFLFSLLALSSGVLKAQQLQLPPDFYDELVGENWKTAVGLYFDKNGRGYVWEKRGAVFILDENGEKLTAPLIDISEEVGNWRDHGLLGFALHPNFQTNGYFYLLYVVDRHHYLYFGTDDYDPDVTITNDATIGRITRYQADPANDFSTTVPGSRKIILGQGAGDGLPILIVSHGVGSLVFGEDGTLLASFGDGGSFLSTDVGSAEETYYAKALAEGIIRPEDNVGSYKSMMINNLNGKIIRIDPETGEGVPSNPFYDSAFPNAARSKVWALGFRNPYRFTRIPGTGSHHPEDGQPGTFFICDVGSAKWEELNMMTEGGRSFGWPIVEGMQHSYAFNMRQTANRDAPNPLAGTGGCDREFFTFHDLFAQDYRDSTIIFLNPCDEDEEIPSQIPTFKHKRPILAWSGLLWNPPPRAVVPGYEPGTNKPIAISITSEAAAVEGSDFSGFTGIPGFFYDQDNFPESYRGAFFLADLSGWIRSLRFDEKYHVTQIDTFASWDDKGVVDIALNPANGCLYWIHVYNNQVHKICYGGDPAPVARALSDITYGPSPLTVAFNGSDSFDPNGGPISYFWDFGDGQTSTESNPIHTFTASDEAPVSFEAMLTVTDSSGQTSTEMVLISLNNTPPKVEISSFKDGGFYATSGVTLLSLEADVQDDEHEEAQLSYLWKIFLHHNTHHHPEEPVESRTTTAIIDPIGCGTEPFWYRVRLTITDPNGLQGTDEKELFPYCGPPFFELNPLTGEVYEDSIDLNWSTSSEEGLSHFEIQRTTDYHFESIGEVGASGNSNAEEFYRFEDMSPIRGPLYYRLKVVRMDGVYEFSNTIALNYPKRRLIYIYPNPAKDEITVFLKKTTASLVELKIINTIGISVYKNSWPTNKGVSFDQEVSINHLPAGLYYCQINNGEGKFVEPFVIAR